MPTAHSAPLFAAVLVKFSQEVVSVTEDGGQAPVTVVAMGDLSSPFSVIVMAMNGTAYGKLDSGTSGGMEMCITSVVVCRFSPLMLNFKFIS